MSYDASDDAQEMRACVTYTTPKDDIGMCTDVAHNTTGVPTDVVHNYVGIRVDGAHNDTRMHNVLIICMHICGGFRHKMCNICAHPRVICYTSNVLVISMHIYGSFRHKICIICAHPNVF